MDLCKITLIGNVGRDPEMRFTQSGKQMLSFSVACNRLGPRPLDGSEPERITEWFNVTCFSGTAERLQNLISKGTRVYVEGRFQLRKYQRADGTPGYSLDVLATEVQVLTPRPRGDELTADAPVGATAALSGGPALRPVPDPEAESVDDVPF
ncbi:MAG: single-stranded DNA-binding protein [Chloroflexi bacterium]|nr:single-stranded DNA-binding protein [Chloroflexota bacterium]